jgi:hypothetical protein
VARFEFFLVRPDYERLAGHELFSRMCFVRHDEYSTRKIPVLEGLLAIPDLGAIDAPASQHQEQYSVFPTKPVVKARQFTRKIARRKPQKRYTLNGSDLDVWLLFQPCVSGKRHLLPGHFETTDDNSATRSLFERIKKCFEKEFVKTRYWTMPNFVGQAALELQKKGYRLCANESFSPDTDLKLQPEPNRTRKVKKFMRRRTLAETWRHLEKEGEGMPRDARGKPFVPPRMPSHDDEQLGWSFFRTSAHEADYSYCTLPRTYFGRSELNEVNFRNTDLSESRMCWNDFFDCDFAKADLSGCDMRASNFTRCKFDGADLRRADLRRSSFEDSSFQGANLKGAVMDNDSAADWATDEHLSKAQVATIFWHDEPGGEPDGG